MKLRRLTTLQLKDRKFHSFKEDIKNAIIQFDLFSQPIQLLVKKKTRHQTFYGGFMTFVIALIASSSFFSQLIEMYSKEKPFIVTSIQQDENPEKVVLSPQIFNVAFAVQDLYPHIKFIITLSEILNPYKNFSIFNVTFEHKIKKATYNQATGQKDLIITSRKIPLEPCNSERHFQIQKLKSYYSKYTQDNLNSFFCPNFEEWIKQPPEIEGVFNQDVWQWAQFTVSSCVNSSENGNNCSSKEEINRKLLSGYMTIYFSDTISDLHQPGNPGVVIGKEIFSTFSNKLGKELDIYLQHTITESDDGSQFYPTFYKGIILSEKHTYDTISYLEYNEQISYNVMDSFLSVKLMLSSQKTVNQSIRDPT